MITITGVEVNPGGETAPTLYDIGYGLAAVIRFGGHVRRPWSVLEHSYACAYYAEYCGDGPIVQLHALIHDAHECITGDIPRPWKTDDMRLLQAELDRRIYTVHGITPPDEATVKRVKEIDEEMLKAETMLIGPPIKAPIDYDQRAKRAMVKTQAHVSYTTVEGIAKDYEGIVLSLKRGIEHFESSRKVSELQPT